MRILILCTGNSARSQMAAAVLRALDPRLDVLSAGTAPAPAVNRYAIRAMKEIGIDLSAERPKDVQQFLGQPFDYVITVCEDADRSCPAFSGSVARRMHLGFPDPARAGGTDDEIISVFRQVRDGIRAEVTGLYHREISRTLD